MRVSSEYLLAYTSLTHCFCFGATLTEAMSSAYPEMKRPPSGKLPLLDEKGDVVSVPALMNYVHPSSEAIIHIRRDTTGDDQTIEGVVWDTVEVDVKNGRKVDMTLERNGFSLANSPLAKPIDFFDTHDVIHEYYPDCEGLLQKILGASVLVRAFDHNVRLNERAEKAGTTLKRGGGSKAQQPLGVVHGDYTRTSAPQRIEQLSGPPKINDVLRLKLTQGESLLEEAIVHEALQGQRRFALINVWRSIDPSTPVQSQALACADAQSVSGSDLRTLQIHYADRVGENYLPYHNKRHEWFYFPEMTMNEALLIKQWDSNGGIAVGKADDSDGCSSFAIHSAFFGPNEESMPPRQSIEVRCVCIW